MADCTVIGAAGYVGRRLAARLEADGHRVFAPVRDDPRLMTHDLGQVYYCAGLTADYLARPFDTVEAHVTVLARLLKSARFERLVYCSSTRLYDWAGPGAGAEDGPLTLIPSEPRHLYDLSKALGENLCLTQSGGRAAVVRLASVWDAAPDAPGFLPQWLNLARASRTVSLDSAPGYARDYVRLDDTVAAMRAVMDAGAGGIFNVATGENVSNGEMAAVFEAAGWRIAFGRDAAAPQAPLCDVSRIRALGVSPVPVRDALGAVLSQEEFRAAD